jgi:hypothetical protein
MADSEIPKTKSEKIRELGREGTPVAEIAHKLDIRYQHARKVLLDAGLLPGSTRAVSSERMPKEPTVKTVKPILYINELLVAGFAFKAKWKLAASGEVSPDTPLPKEVGVYAFVKDSVVLYVGVATMGLAKRLYFYGRPGRSQLTSLRLNKIIKDELATFSAIDIYTASPSDLDWNGLPIHGSAGLELGLIKKYNLPWNKRSAG